MPSTDRAPIRLETETAVLVAESIQEMSTLEVQDAVIAFLVMDGGGVGQTGSLQGCVDDFPGGHLEAPMLCSEPPRQCADHLVIGARLRQGFDNLARNLQNSMTPGDIEIVML